MLLNEKVNKTRKILIIIFMIKSISLDIGVNKSKIENPPRKAASIKRKVETFLFKTTETVRSKKKSKKKFKNKIRSR